MEHMTCKEIRDRYNRGIGLVVLADLNQCDPKIIRRIVDGEDYEWSWRNTSRKAHDICVLVNSTDGIIYPSMRAAEKGEGISHTLFSWHFRNGIDKAMIKGKEYHLYRKKSRE